MRKAIVIGATGLVGSALVDALLEREDFSSVLVLVRRATGRTHAKLEERLVDFGHPERWAQWVKGDVLFSAMGTTLKTAGSKEAQYRIDYHYQYNTAKEAAVNGVRHYVLISSAGANPSSMLFYPKMKGELEDAVLRLPFPHIQILRPGLLTGNRPEKRAGEEWGERVLRFLNGIGLLKKQRPVPASIVAKAMINASFRTAPLERHSLLQVFALAGVDTQSL